MYLGIVIPTIILLLAVGLFYASYSIRMGVYIQTYCQKRTENKVVALTFDDGPHPKHTSQILDILQREGVKATFFVIGEKVRKYPEIVYRMVSEGHAVGNHSYSHTPCFPLMKRKDMVTDLKRCEEVIADATGQRTTIFRPPYGVTNPTIARAVKDTGYTVVGWSIRSLDTMSRRCEKVVHRIKRKLKKGRVILLHDDRPESPRLLEMVLEMLRTEDYTIQRADILLEIDTNKRQ